MVPNKKPQQEAPGLNTLVAKSVPLREAKRGQPFPISIYHVTDTEKNHQVIASHNKNLKFTILKNSTKNEKNHFTSPEIKSRFAAKK